MSQTKPDPNAKYDATGTGRAGEPSPTGSNWDPNGLLRDGRGLGSGK